MFEGTGTLSTTPAVDPHSTIAGCGQFQGERLKVANIQGSARKHNDDWTFALTKILNVRATYLDYTSFDSHRIFTCVYRSAHA
jgi:hypothetical protein